MLVPLVDGEIKGDIGEETRSVSRQGMGDSRFRFSTTWIGGKPLTPTEFATHRPNTILGNSLLIMAPTGEYNSEQLVNIGSNRWAFKPEIGGSQSLGDFFIEGAMGAWLFTDNPQFFQDTRRSQEPLWTSQPKFGSYGEQKWRRWLKAQRILNFSEAQPWHRQGEQRKLKSRSDFSQMRHFWARNCRI